MKLPRFLVRALMRRADRLMLARRPDFVIGGLADPYMLRWWVIPRNRVFNVYLHEVIRSDDDRALHDHPWVNASILLDGAYIEHRICEGGIHERLLREAGSIVVRRARAAHRLEVLPDRRAISLFITGPRIREWGFHCVEQGWVLWKTFVSKSDYGSVGRGCGE
jgi:hypothetical protein